MTRALALLLVVLLLLAPGQSRADPAPRTILALWDSREEERIRLTRIHTMAEMPLNHLGLDVVYHDVAQGLPAIGGLAGLRGIVTWFKGDPFDDPAGYMAWAGDAIDRGVRFVVMGQPGVRAARDGRPAPGALVDRFFGRLGLRDDDGYTDLTHRAAPVIADSMIGFERPLGGALPGYPLMRRLDNRFASHLVLRRGGDPATDSHLVATGPTGGFVAENYARHYDPELNRSQWIIDPFAFFRAAFATDDLPKPDVTTISGRRIYFSHIDGDGWRNITEIKPYAEKRVLSSAMIRLKAIEPYPDLPVTVAPIVGDIDPAVFGTDAARAEVLAQFALPQVEPASQTWTHPFFWRFYEHYTPESEAAFINRRDAPRGTMLTRILGRAPTGETYALGTEGAAEGKLDIGAYPAPRAFLVVPFSLEHETKESLDYMTSMAPPGKPAKLLQWSGDTQPFEAAVASVRRAGGRNLNGGDSRFDAEFPSYTSVSPIGAPVGAERQIYAAASNENTYTDLWTGRFFGFQDLIRTVRNTETPIRVKPFNIYYHMYSGQKVSSLNALLRNLDAARAAEIAPVTAHHYAGIAAGFYTTRLVPDGERRWRVEDRGDLATIRFDRAAFTAVDFARSEGVLGQRHHQGSLYVALDPAHAAPVVALAEAARADVPPPADRPYLVHGRWVLSGLALDGPGFAVRARGFGDGAMVWRVPVPGRWEAVAARAGAEVWRGSVEVGADGLLSVVVPASAVEPLDLAFRPLESG